MGTKYTDQSASSYDSTPPADDGTVSEANKVKWSTIKTKLSDPVKTQADAISDALVTHFDNGPRALITNTTLGASDYGKIIQVSGSGVTLTLTDAASLTAGWYCRIINNDSSNGKTIARATGGDTINGSAANYTMEVSQGIDVVVNAAANGFLLRSIVINPVTTDTTQTISVAKTYTATQTFQLTDAGASAGPSVNLDRNSSSPAANDALAQVNLLGRDSGGNQTTYADIYGSIADPVDGSEDGVLVIQTVTAGTLSDKLAVGTGVQVLSNGSAPTGGDKGAGTINSAGDIYANGTKIASASGTTPVVSNVGIIVKRKTADESVTSSTTLQDDDHLTFAIAASEEWVVRITGWASAAINTTGIKMSMSVPSGATLRQTLSLTSDPSVGQCIAASSTGSALTFSAASLSIFSDAMFVLDVWILNSTNAGNVTLQWAQGTSSGTALTFNKGAFLTAHRVN